VLVNNAGMLLSGAPTEIPLGQHAWLLNINVNDARSWKVLQETAADVRHSGGK
jgi:hypothetical protein